MVIQSLEVSQQHQITIGGLLTPPSHLLIDAVIEYAKEQDKPLILGIFNLEGVERAKKLFDKKGFHQIGGMYYRK